LLGTAGSVVMRVGLPHTNIHIQEKTAWCTEECQIGDQQNVIL
jgi:hypothetical protein